MALEGKVWFVNIDEPRLTYKLADCIMVEIVTSDSSFVLNLISQCSLTQCYRTRCNMVLTKLKCLLCIVAGL